METWVPGHSGKTEHAAGAPSLPALLESWFVGQQKRRVSPALHSHRPVAPSRLLGT